MNEIINILDLQIFAEPNLNVQTTGTSTLSDEMKTFYSKDLIELATANLVHAQFGEKMSIPKNGGKTVEFRQFSAFPKATTPLTEGVTPAGVPVKVTSINKTLEEFGAYTAVTDILEMTTIDPIIVEITSKHADSMGLTLDTIVRNELNTGTNVIYAPNGSTEVTSRANLTGDCKMNMKLIAKAVTFLKKQNAPKFDGSYVGIIHPSVSYDIMTDENWIDVQKYSNATNIFEGEIGKLYGVRFVESTEAAVFTGSEGGKNGQAVYSCLFVGKGAYKVIDVGGSGAQIIVKGKGSAGTSDPLDQRSTIGWKIPMFGAKIVIPEYLVRVECGSSFSIIDAGSNYNAAA
ncbi:MAG: N4-gp56 family major capsid protein [Acutalibacteraceae bacterium]